MKTNSNSETLERLSVGLPQTPKVQRAWADILDRIIITKAVLPSPGFYPDFTLPDVRGIAAIQQDYASDISLRLADLARLPVISRDQSEVLEELLEDPSVLLGHTFADLDRWESRTQRYLEEFRKLSGKLDKPTELELAENDVEGEE